MPSLAPPDSVTELRSGAPARVSDYWGPNIPTRSVLHRRADLPLPPALAMECLLSPALVALWTIGDPYSRVRTEPRPRTCVGPTGRR